MKLIWLMIIDFILLIIVIGLIDYLLFYKNSRCPHCGKHTAEWFSYIPATFLELLMFVGGVLFGALYF